MRKAILLLTTVLAVAGLSFTVIAQPSTTSAPAATVNTNAQATPTPQNQGENVDQDHNADHKTRYNLKRGRE